MILSDKDFAMVLSAMPVVCVDGVVVNDAGEYLLVRRKNEPLKGEFWVPGGRVMKNERLEDAVARKMREEIGVDVDILGSMGFFEAFFERSRQEVAGGVHMISLVYRVRPRSLEIRLDDQSAEWGWFNELPELFRQYKYLRMD